MSGALLVTAKIPYHFWRPLIPLVLIGAFALMVLVLVPGIGVTVNGARAWIRFGYFAVQPAEVLKFALLLYCADLLARRADRMHELRATLHPMLVVLGVSGVLLMLQPDLGGALVMASIVLGVAFIAGTPLIPLAATAGLASAVGMVFVDEGRLPARALAGVPRPRPAQAGRRLPGVAVADRHRVGWRHRRRPGRQQAEVGLPARGPHRLHLRHHRRGARPRRRGGRVRALLRLRPPRRAGRAAGQGPLRHARSPAASPRGC